MSIDEPNGVGLDAASGDFVASKALSPGPENLLFSRQGFVGAAHHAK
jgi:hypothetical protein